MTRAVIYCRCSTEEECQRDALIRQAAEARECVRRLNWSLEDEYIESRSGTSVRGREEYQRLFGDLLRDKFEIVVIKSQDRLMRNTRDWYIFIDRLVTCKKRLYLYLENRFYSTDDALIAGIKAILAEEYSRELSRKINNAHRNRQKTGSALMLTSNTYGYRKLADKSFTILEEEAQVKRKMYQLCAAGLGSRTIARILQEEGVQKRNGNCFSDSDIRRMIRNPINKGTVVMNRRHYDFDTRQTVKNPEEQFYIYENRIPAIVSEELWEAANQEIDKRRRDGKKEKKTAAAQANKWGGTGIHKGKHLLSGKFVCGLCGAPFYRTTRKRKQDSVHEWKCRTYLEQGRKKAGREGGCENIHLEENTFFLLIGKGILPDSSGIQSPDTQFSQKQFPESFSQAAEPALIRVFLKLLRICLEEQAAKELNYYKQLEKKIKHQQQLLLDKYLEGMVDEELYKEKCRELQKKRKDRITDSLVEGATARDSQTEAVLIEERLGEIERFLLQTHSVSKAHTLCMLEQVEKIVVYPDHLELVENKGKCIIAASISDMLY